MDQSSSEEPATVTGSEQHVPPCEEEEMTEEQQAVVEQYREQQAVTDRYREQQTDVKSKSMPAAKQTGPTFFPGYFFSRGPFLPRVLFYPGVLFFLGSFFFGGGRGAGGGSRVLLVVRSFWVGCGEQGLGIRGSRVVNSRISLGCHTGLQNR